jgi:hypothetical protein
MKENTRESTPKHPRIAGIEETTDTLTGRAGLALFARYLDGIGLQWFVERWFGPLRKSDKGMAVSECFRQVLLFLLDGTSRHLTYFDEMKRDAGYAATIERNAEHLLSSSPRRTGQDRLPRWAHRFEGDPRRARPPRF